MKGQAILKNNKKKILDLVFNIGAVVVMNCVLQFLLYPAFNRELGAEKNGIVLALLSIICVTAGSCGTTANYSRLINVNEREISNGDYVIMLLLSGVLCAVVGIICLWRLELLTVWSAIFLVILLFLTSFRYYGDVEYKEKTNFLFYFLYYLLISVGYVIGMFIFNKTGNWIIAIACGELLGVAFSVFASKIFRSPFKVSINFKIVVTSFSFLLLSNLIENVILHADRLILVSILGGEEVTYYYIASLFGKVVALLSVPVNSLVISYLIRYKGGLNKKLWSGFTFGSLIIGSLCFVACIVASIIIIPLLYPNDYAFAKPYLVGAMISQVMYFLSSVLLVVLLRFTGEKKQFICNVIFAVGFFGLSIPASFIWGLTGFVYSSMVANTLRFILLAVWGFIACKKGGGNNMKDTETDALNEETDKILEEDKETAEN